jgi:high-affinity nickel-transport protein
LTIVAVGGAIVFFTIVIHQGSAFRWNGGRPHADRLGMWNLTGFFEHIRGIRPLRGGGANGLHAHFHSHGDYVHSHPSGREGGQHGHRDDRTPVAWLDRRFTGLGVYQILRPLLVGFVHGLAGSAAVALLVLALIKNPWWAIAYLVLFGIGTIAGMMLITAAIGAVVAYASSRFTRVERYLRVASGLLSLGFGLFLAYQIAVVDGLITGYPDAMPGQ